MKRCSINLNKVGPQLKNLREEHNLTQAATAEYLNLSRQAISNWENSNCLPDIENFLLLLVLYKTDVENFVLSIS